MEQQELKLRRDKIRALMAEQKIDAAIITYNVNLLYTCGRIVSGFLYLPVEGAEHLFIKRPNNVEGERVHQIRKPEQIADIMREAGLAMPKRLMLEGDELSYSEYTRLAGVFDESEIVNGSRIMAAARSVKTPFEIELFRRSGVINSEVYNMIPSLYRHGMTDRELAVEIEYQLRKAGNLGIFRIAGQNMEIFMGSLLAGDNASEPSPYDFALGGAGLDVSLPVGMSGSVVREEQSIMVDYNGNYYGYMCDMTRVYSVGRLPQKALTAHQVCIEVQNEVAAMARPGVRCEELYDRAVDIVSKAGFSDNFMGNRQQARFIGHGVGLEINELPVLAPRAKLELERGMVFALEPKIVIEGIGAVGVENTWAVTDNGVEKLTVCPEEIVELG